MLNCGFLTSKKVFLFVTLRACNIANKWSSSAWIFSGSRPPWNEMFKIIFFRAHLCCYLWILNEMHLCRTWYSCCICCVLVAFLAVERCKTCPNYFFFSTLILFAWVFFKLIFSNTEKWFLIHKIYVQDIDCQAHAS